MPLPVSTVDCTASDNIAELPVTPATTNSVVSIAVLAAMAPQTVSFDSALG